VERVQQCWEQGYTSGVAGFGSIADLTAVLLPDLPDNQPLAIGFVYEPSEQINSDTLLRTLQDAVARSAGEVESASAGVHLINAA
jgi:hypothetical protein